MGPKGYNKIRKALHDADLDQNRSRSVSYAADIHPKALEKGESIPFVDITYGERLQGGETAVLNALRDYVVMDLAGQEGPANASTKEVRLHPFSFEGRTIRFVDINYPDSK